MWCTPNDLITELEKFDSVINDVDIVDTVGDATYYIRCWFYPARSIQYREIDCNLTHEDQMLLIPLHKDFFDIFKDTSAILPEAESPSPKFQL